MATALVANGVFVIPSFALGQTNMSKDRFRIYSEKQTLQTKAGLVPT
jgi:hypothetical protein